jgi:uncharacterized protein (TIGR00730 family)
MSQTLSSLCVYCGSSLGARPEYAQLARQVGAELAQQGRRLVYGGGRAGLMGVLADAAMAAGGEVIGVMPEPLMVRELGHRGITTLHVVRDMHERKYRMAELAQGFIALPGGWGTLEELSEMVTWSQLGLHQKPVGLLNTAGYFDGLLEFITHMISERFVGEAQRDLILVDSDPSRLLERLDASALAAAGR